MKKFMYSVILVIALLTPQKARGFDGIKIDPGAVAGAFLVAGIAGGVILTVVGYKIFCALYKQTIATPEHEGS